ncbi:hypothetical protein BaRGS_00030808 [Batillaria attramentaria]|uniref:Uncharacterized protein n=1 Tax=Batillaria attramentaria TaxID=370345 RepID=A0ABD0JSK6_9CAEN
MSLRARSEVSGFGGSCSVSGCGTSFPGLVDLGASFRGQWDWKPRSGVSGTGGLVPGLVKNTAISLGVTSIMCCVFDIIMPSMYAKHCTGLTVE